MDISRRRFLRTSALLIGAGALSGLSLAGCDSSFSKKRVAQDMFDRDVNVPDAIEKIFCSNPIGTVDTYMLCPEKLVGWNFKPAEAYAKYLDQDMLDLPSLGVWMGAGSVPNSEEVAAQDPDVILCFWTNDETGADMADEIERETGIPVALIDYDLRSAPETYRFLGEFLDVAERAEEIASYCEDRIESISAIVDGIPESERKSVFLAQGVGGLTTDPVGSMHVTDAFELLGIENVADMPGTDGQGMGMPSVNLEQIVSWDPDAVLVSEYSMSDATSSDVYSEILADKSWQNVKCVKDGEVYRIPQCPFSWFGRPPSVMRILGCMWLLKMLYPSYSQSIDLTSEVQSFFKLFLGYEISEDEIDEIINP